jgi:hypothetical protein
MLSNEICKRTDQSDSRNQKGFSAEGPCGAVSNAGRIYFSKAFEAAVGIGLLALCATAFYRVRELLAALILFSVLFGIVAIAVLILWLVERGAHVAAVRLEMRMTHIASRDIAASARAFANHFHWNPPWN